MRVLKFRIIDDIRYNAITTYKSKLLYTQTWGKDSNTSRKKTHLHIHAHEMEPSKKKKLYTPFEGISSSLLWSIFNFQRKTEDYERSYYIFVIYSRKLNLWAIFRHDSWCWSVHLCDKANHKVRLEKKNDIIFAIFFFLLLSIRRF